MVVWDEQLLCDNGDESFWSRARSSRSLRRPRSPSSSIGHLSRPPPWARVSFWYWLRERWRWRLWSRTVHTARTRLKSSYGQARGPGETFGNWPILLTTSNLTRFTVHVLFYCSFVKTIVIDQLYGHFTTVTTFFSFNVIMWIFFFISPLPFLRATPDTGHIPPLTYSSRSYRSIDRHPNRVIYILQIQRWTVI